MDKFTLHTDKMKRFGGNNFVENLTRNCVQWRQFFNNNHLRVLKQPGN